MDNQPITPNAAKKDYAARLQAAGIPFEKLTAKTWSFEGFGFGRVVCVTVHGAKFPPGKGAKSYTDGVPKPSEGGYMVEDGGATFYAG